MCEPDAAGSFAGLEAEEAVALREGLVALPVPALSREFDAQVLAAVRDARPLREQLRELLRWRALRPVLVGAACGLALTCGAYAWVARLPVSAARPVVKRAPGAEREKAPAGVLEPSLRVFPRDGERRTTP